MRVPFIFLRWHSPRDWIISDGIDCNWLTRIGNTMHTYTRALSLSFPQFPMALLYLILSLDQESGHLSERMTTRKGLLSIPAFTSRSFPVQHIVVLFFLKSLFYMIIHFFSEFTFEYYYYYSNSQQYMANIMGRGRSATHLTPAPTF